MDLNSQQFVQDFRILKKSLGSSGIIIDNAKHVIRDADEKGGQQCILHVEKQILLLRYCLNERYQRIHLPL
jgi:hypothetical protein